MPVFKTRFAVGLYNEEDKEWTLLKDTRRWERRNKGGEERENSLLDDPVIHCVRVHFQNPILLFALSVAYFVTNIKSIHACRCNVETGPSASLVCTGTPVQCGIGTFG